MPRPQFLRAPLPLPAPGKMISRALVAAFNHLMRGQKEICRLREIEGKHIRLRATDAPWTLNLRVENGVLQAADSDATAHVTIRGNLSDLHLLATRKEDPDTLFFERRLSMEGETHTGLLIKNMLDSLDWSLEAHFLAVFPRPVAGLAIVASRALRRADRQSDDRIARSIPAAPRRNPSQ